jgi:methionine synthase I (cobalamin-dependent)
VELLEDLAREYCSAGAEIVEACTFGASPIKPAQYDLDQQADDINRKAVLAVRNVVGVRNESAADGLGGTRTTERIRFPQPPPNDNQRPSAFFRGNRSAEVSIRHLRKPIP